MARPEWRRYTLPMTDRIEGCRVSGSRNLVSVLDRDDQALTGLFPLPADPPVPIGHLPIRTRGTATAQG